MCGHVGVVGSIGPKEKQVFKQLLQVGSLRGPHSAGVYFKDRNQEFGDSYHALGHGHEITDYGRFNKDLDGSKDTYVLLGHNRWATQGAVDLKHAHPFAYGDIIGAHNGTVPEWYWKKLMFGGNESMDSKALMCSIAAVGGAETVGQLNFGAWCLIWFDEVKETIHFLRNHERDLWLCTSNGGKTLWWASEAGMLYWVLGRNGVKVDTNSMIQLPVDKEFSFKVPDNNVRFWLPEVKDAPKKPFESVWKKDTSTKAWEDYEDYSYSRTRAPIRGDSKFYYVDEVLGKIIETKPVPWEDVEDSYDTHGSCCASCGLEIPKFSQQTRWDREQQKLRDVDKKYFFYNGVTAPMFVCGDCWENTTSTYQSQLIDLLCEDKTWKAAS